MNDQRQMMAAEALKALLEAELRKHGSGSEVVIAPVGELGDWTAAHGAALDPEAADAYIVLLSRLKEDYLLDRFRAARAAERLLGRVNGLRLPNRRATARHGDARGGRRASFLRPDRVPSAGNTSLPG